MLDDSAKRFGVLTGGIGESIRAADERIIEGSSAANYVRARISTKLALKSIDIDTSLMTPERKLMLEEFIVSTVNGLIEKAIAELDEQQSRAMREAAAKMMSSVTPDMMKNVTAAITGTDGKIAITDPKTVEALTDIVRKLTKDIDTEEKH